MQPLDWLFMKKPAGQVSQCVVLAQVSQFVIAALHAGKVGETYKKHYSGNRIGQSQYPVNSRQYIWQSNKYSIQNKSLYITVIISTNCIKGVFKPEPKSRATKHSPMIAPRDNLSTIKETEILQF